MFACLSQSAMFSGLNLGLFYMSRLQLEIEAENGSRAASKILHLRRDSNWLLATILWGNVSVNVLLTQLSGSLMLPIFAFLFSTVGITLFGEIMPQAYFSRHSLRVGAFFSPVIRIYQYLLFPITKPTGLLLDLLVGAEGPRYFKEKDFHGLLQKHIISNESDIGKAEGQGALNFLKLDDLPLHRVGKVIDPDSIIQLPLRLDLPMIPDWEADPEDPFITSIGKSGKKWVIFVDPENFPRLTINADFFLRDVYSGREIADPYSYCHRPIVVRDETKRLGEILPRFYVEEEHKEDNVIDNDLIIVWGEKERRIITGADILGSLLHGIVGRRRAREAIAEAEAERAGRIQSSATSAPSSTTVSFAQPASVPKSMRSRKKRAVVQPPG